MDIHLYPDEAADLYPASRINDDLDQSLVYVEYGKCAGLPTLTGVGRIVDHKVSGNVIYVDVVPVDGHENSIPLEKWVALLDVQFVWAD